MIEANRSLVPGEARPTVPVLDVFNAVSTHMTFTLSDALSDVFNVVATHLTFTLSDVLADVFNVVSTHLTFTLSDVLADVLNVVSTHLTFTLSVAPGDVDTDVNELNCDVAYIAFTTASVSFRSSQFRIIFLELGQDKLLHAVCHKIPMENFCLTQVLPWFPGV